MALSDMFGLLGGSSSDPLDIYGDLFTKEQKAALQQRQMDEGLLRMAGAFGKAAQPSRMPTSFMGALGEAAGAMAGTGDQAAESAIKAMKVGEDVRESRAKREALAAFYKKIAAARARETQLGLPPGTLTSQVPGATAQPGPTTSTTATPPLGSGYLGPTNEELGAPPVSMGLPSAGTSPLGFPEAPGAAPAGAPPRTGLPARIGMRGTGPNAVMIDLDTGQPIQSSPGGPITMPGAPPAGQQNTGLLPPQDQVVGPDGQPLTGQGVFPSMLASFTGGPAGATLPFRLASSTPTEGAPPGAAGGDDWQRVKPLIRKYESGGRNIEQGVVGPQGGYNPSTGTVTGPSSASGYYQMIDPTWRAAARKVGIDTDKYPRAINAPEELQDKAAEALYREQGLKPWAPYNSRLAAATGYQGGGQDVVIPSGRGIPASALRNVADTGPAPVSPAGSGVIPGLNMTTQEALELNLLAKMGGLGDVVSPFLEQYYKSPGYLAEKARTEAKATKDVALEMDPLITKQTEIAKAKVEYEWKPKIEEAVQKLQSPILDERNKAKADIDRYSKELELNQNAALTPTKATVFGPGGVMGTEEMTASEFARRQRDRANRIAKGDTTFKPGDIVVTPTGAAPAEHEYVMTPQGGISARAVPGTPAAEKAAEAEAKKLQTEHAKLISRDTVVREVDNIGKLMDDAIFPTTGFVGSILQNLGGTNANNIRLARQTLESRLSADTINAQRAASPTGAAFGNTSDTDMAILRTALVNLDQSQTKEQLRDRLQILKQAYVDAVHGPGMSRLLPETPVLKPPAATTAPAPTGAPRTGRYNPATGRVEYQ